MVDSDAFAARFDECADIRQHERYGTTGKVAERRREGRRKKEKGRRKWKPLFFPLPSSLYLVRLECRDEPE
jgi:hypothetical protein